MTTMISTITAKSKVLVLLATALFIAVTNIGNVEGFNVPQWQRPQKITTRSVLSSSSSSLVLRMASSSSPPPSSSSNSFDNLFKAGLLANCEEEACILAKKKIKSVQDLGWKSSSSSSSSSSSTTRRRESSIQPKFWAWGGADELALQNKPNYDPSNTNTPEPWLSLEDFYSIVGDDTAVADTIFVALAGGRGHATKSQCASVLDQWYGTTTDSKSADSSGSSSKDLLSMARPSRQRQHPFNDDAFYSTVKKGQNEFIAQWTAFLAITGFCLLGIVAPTNPLQLALVGVLESIK